MPYWPSCSQSRGRFHGTQGKGANNSDVLKRVLVQARLPDENRRGPRLNSYDVRLSRWMPITADDRKIWVPNALASITDYGLTITEHIANRPRAAAAAYRILQRQGVPLLRRFLRGTMVHVGGIAPGVAQAVLDDLRRYAPNAVVQLPFPVEGEADSHVYATTHPSDDELNALLALVTLDREVLPIHVLGEYGETFVRACFVKTDRYTHITQIRHLGYVIAAAGTNRLDLMVFDTVTGERYAVSVKNQREVMGRRSPWIKDCIDMAAAHNARPWLIPSFATPEAVEACKAQGVRCTPIGARIAPAKDAQGRSMKVLLRKLYPVHGGEPFMRMGAERLPNGEGQEFIERLRELSD